MISQRHRCLFVHIPKTGGQSVEHVFLALHGLDWGSRAPLLLRPNDDPARGPQALAHLLAAEYVELGYLSQADYDDYYKFAFVRNPWARAVSEYEYRRPTMPRIGFAAWLKQALASSDRFDDRYRHVMPQYDYVHDGNGRRIVDFVGRFETLRWDWLTVCAALRIKRDPLPHVNKSATRSFWRRLGVSAPKRHYSARFDAYSRDLCADYYASDIATFGYEFERRSEPARC